jgi:hypothetical protein
MTHQSRRLTPDAARLLTLSTEPWLSCEDCFELMDGYVEVLLAGPGGTDLPGMRVHLTACAACAEETESLLLLVAGEDDVDPGPALQRLHDQTG